MTKIITVFVSLVFLNLSTHAQKVNHSLGIGVRYMSLDMPDDMVFSPNVYYNLNVSKRLSFSSQIGGVVFKGKEHLFGILPTDRKRVMLDLDAKFAIVKFKNNYLRIGGGPSIWHSNDETVFKMSWKSESPDFVPIITSYEYQTRKYWELGFNAISELEIGITNKFSLMGSFGFASFNKQGTSSILGLNCLYKLK